MSILVSICVESNHRKLKIKTQLCGEGTDIGYVNYVCIFLLQIYIEFYLRGHNNVVLMP